MGSSEKIRIIEISKNRFNIYMLFTRNPIINVLAIEEAYYSNEDNSILGVLLLDILDKEYNYILLSRDENKQFRAFEVKVGFDSKNNAVEMLINSLRWHTAQGMKKVVHGVTKKGLDLFKIVVPRSHLHPYFVRLSNDRSLLASKKVLIEIANHLEDIDGNFIEQFQSLNGFDSRIWELYLFASFVEMKFEINRDYSSPDFLLKKGLLEIGIEAVIVARKDNPPQYLFDKEKVIRPTQITDKLKNETPLRFGSALYSKIQKEYWKLEHMKNKPFLIAIADFHDNSSMVWSFNALVEYLYGTRKSLKIDKEGKEQVISQDIRDYEKSSGVKIPSGFFSQKDVENVSGVLFSSTGTLSKFTRMGVEAGFGELNQFLLRFGDRFDPTPNSFKPISFVYRVEEGGKEKWAEGLNLFHNPNAKIPLSIDLMPEIAHHQLVGKELISQVPDFHPFSSFLINSIVTNK